MNGRGLRSGALRLIAVAAVALGIVLIASVTSAQAEYNWGEGTSQSVVVSDDGSTSVGPDSAPADEFTPSEYNWG